MRIFPLALIAVGIFGVLKHFGLIDATFLNLFWPLLLVGIGLALLVRGPRWRADLHERMPGRWERRMHRHFGPGWANLSEDERERFRAGMRRWHVHGDGGGGAPAPAAARDGSPPSSPAQARPPGEPS